MMTVHRQGSGWVCWYTKRHPTRKSNRRKWIDKRRLKDGIEGQVLFVLWMFTGGLSKDKFMQTLAQVQLNEVVVDEFGDKYMLNEVVSDIKKYKNWRMLAGRFIKKYAIFSDDKWVIKDEYKPSILYWPQE